jgi:hypothetical protein
MLAVAVMTIALGATSGFAHGHKGGGTVAAYAVCKVKSCTLTGQHKHSGVYYTAHYYGDGHSYHGYCTISGCTLTGYHKHGEVYCFGHIASNSRGQNVMAGNHHGH